MATTSPDNIFSPNAGDQYALVQDLGALADSVQTAIIRRGNLFVGSGLQRVAFTDAPEGANWQDTDGSQKKYVRLNSEWVMTGDGYYFGTGAQRTAFSNAPNGVMWQDTDGARQKYARLGGSWRLTTVSGSITVTVPITTTTLSPVIPYPGGSFDSPPFITLTQQSPPAVARYMTVRTNAVGISSFRMSFYSYASATYDVTVDWMATAA